MWRGLYTAAAGMITETKRTDTLANNLANADTAGFKRDVAINEEFEPMLMRRINDYDPTLDITAFKRFRLNTKDPAVGTLGLGAYIAEIAVDREQGSFQTTGNPYDVAISGNGFLAVQTDNGVRYTRDGALFRSNAGILENMKGQAVLDQNEQPITIPGNVRQITIGAQGQIYADGRQLAQMMFVEFGPDRRAVLKQGDNLWQPQEGAQISPATGEIQQGMLERSNSNVVNEMVALINNQRIYEAGAKAVIAQDSLLDKAANELGRVS